MTEKEQSRRVLIIDDSPDIRDSVCEALLDAGYRVHQAKDGLDGLKMLDAWGQPEVILVDLLMPRMNGMDFLRHYMSDRQTPDTRVLVLSVSSEIDEIASRYGADGFLRKPIDLSELLEAIDGSPGVPSNHVVDKDDHHARE